MNLVSTFIIEIIQKLLLDMSISEIIFNQKQIHESKV